MLAWGLWSKKDIARELLINFTVFIIASLGVVLFINFVLLHQGKIEIGSKNVPGFLTLLSLLILVFYIRSDRFLKYYFANDHENT